MPRCPACGRLYPAGTLYCMDDGTALVADAAPPDAALPSASASRELDRLLSESDRPVAAPPVAAPPVAPAVEAAPAPRSGGLVVLLAVLALAVLGLLGVLVWQQKATAEAAEARAADALAQAADARTDADAQAARDAEARAADARDAEAQQAYSDEPGEGTTVWANSPNDGFLALRSAPTVGRGTRLLKIPHGDPLVLGDCLAPTTSPGGRYGSWCRALYAGTSGWVFDAFVTR